LNFGWRAEFEISLFREEPTSKFEVSVIVFVWEFSQRISLKKLSDKCSLKHRSLLETSQLDSLWRPAWRIIDGNTSIGDTEVASVEMKLSWGNHRVPVLRRRIDVLFDDIMDTLKNSVALWVFDSGWASLDALSQLGSEAIAGAPESHGRT
jgi:hypothetical protein